MEFAIWLNILLVILDARRFSSNPRSIYAFFKFCYSFIIGFGIVFIQIMDAVVGYKFVLRDLEVLEYAFVLGYIGIIVGSWLSTIVLRFVSKPANIDEVPQYGDAIVVSAHTKSGLSALAFLSIMSVAIYVAATGLNFGSGSYEARYEDAQGMGFLLRLFPAILPFAAYKLSAVRGPKEFWTFAIVLIAFTGFTYVALNGYRQLLIAGGLLVVIIGLSRRYISGFWLAILGLIIFPTFILTLSFLRYSGEVSSPFRSPLEAAFYFIQGDVFPVDAPLRTYWWCLYKGCPGPDVIWAHLGYAVPRFLWPNKPDLLLDAAGYYTQVITGYGRFVTLSSTILGESFMAGGWWAVWWLGLGSGILTRVCSIWLERSRGLVGFILLANVYMGFFWVREGFENGLYRILLMLTYFMIALILAPIVASFSLPKKTGRKTRLVFKPR
jgi:hypothetical protein